MPTKSAHLIAFLVVLAISLVSHRYVYKNWKRVLLRDFPRRGKQLAKWAVVLFVVMDLPFLFMFFRNRIPGELTTLSKLTLYPFSAWIAVMILWTAILLTMSLVRRTTKAGVALASKIRRANDQDEPLVPALEYTTP